MKQSGIGTNAGQGNNGQEANRNPSSRLQIVAAAVGLTVLLVGGASWMPHADSDRSNDAAALPRVEARAEPTTVDTFPEWPQGDADRGNDAAAQAESASFVYFPAQYENQAREKEEHIQAF